jgi:hypothetical protein
MTGDEERLFRLILDATSDLSKSTKEDQSYMYDVYRMVTDRDWHYDYFTWYIGEVDAHDARRQGQIEGEESLR